MKAKDKMDQQNSHVPGDWIVHQYYGVGQLKGKETKQIGGKEGTYFRLEMSNTTVYIPEDKLESGCFRPIAPADKLKEMREILARPPKNMAGNFTIRKSRIMEAMTENSIESIARMVRDLRARRRNRKTLSQTEDSALRELTGRLLSEWAVAMDWDENEAREKLNTLLDKNGIDE
jgi:RNA polymerase-interacting CarD/CdnL/TRCF family regulator